MDASPVEGDVCVFFDLVWALGLCRLYSSRLESVSPAVLFARQNMAKL